MWNTVAINTNMVTQDTFLLYVLFSLLMGSPSRSQESMVLLLMIKKVILIQELLDLSEQMSDLWICSGDFNTIRWPHESSNGYPTNIFMARFNDFIDQSCLNDIPLSNGCYTWYNFRDPPTDTLIDKFFCSNGILSKFGDGLVCRLPRAVSDYYPLQLTLGSQT